VLKINDTQTRQEYLDKKITYEIYQEERKIVTNKRVLTTQFMINQERNKNFKKHKANICFSIIVNDYQLSGQIFIILYVLFDNLGSFCLFHDQQKLYRIGKY